MTLLIDETHDPRLVSWVASANGHADFPIQNLPLGVFSLDGDGPRGGTAIGGKLLAFADLLDADLFSGEAEIAARAASGNTLNPLLVLGAGPRRALRRRLSALLAADSTERAAIEPLLRDAADATLHLPAAIGDYTDFYVGIHHATNVGKILRPDNPLLPNYKHVPIGYHGRASSIRPTGTEVRRPNGQTKAPDADAPVFGPSARLDYELEMGVWISQGNELGQPIPIGTAGDHIAGLTLLNDWSARDLQAWEYQPLGPFLAKNFLTTVSPWIVTAEALAPFRVAQPARPEGDPRPLPYLWDETDQAEGAFAITLEVALSTKTMREHDLAPHRLSRGPATNMYWTAAQIVTHHTSNGCNLSGGDLLGTGTISAPTDDGFGSLLEITRGGKAPISLESGETRTFIQDGDEILLSGRASRDGYVSIGFGECRGVITPALPA